MPRADEVAWAAGVFDGDGSASGYTPRRRRSRTVQVTVYQATTPVLERFQRALDGHGGIYGPYRSRLYHWTTKRQAAVSFLCRALWPRLGDEKREQLRQAVAGHQVYVGLLTDGTIRDGDGERAWAAGFFDAEGSVTVAPAGSAVLEIPQAAVEGEPSSCLLRFHSIVAAGRISGPRVVPSPWSRLPQYRWVASSAADVERVGLAIRPYLSDEKRTLLRTAVARIR